jgi:hypothetical protein
MKDLARLALRAEQYSSRTSLNRAGRSVSRWHIALESMAVVSPPEVEMSKDLSCKVDGDVQDRILIGTCQDMYNL